MDKTAHILAFNKPIVVIKNKVLQICILKVFSKAFRPQRKNFKVSKSPKLELV